MEYAIETNTLEERDGFELLARTYVDAGHGAPWDEEDGHGPVSEWTTRGKAPGELVLCEDRGSHRFYDFAEACRIARRDGWSAEPFDIPGETERQRSAKAAIADFKRLRAWCRDEWRYVGVVVTATRNGVELGSASLWGIEEDSGDYLNEVASACADEAIAAARVTLAKLCQCESVA